MGKKVFQKISLALKKAVPESRKDKILYGCIILLIAFSAWQESQIADLQERMMNIESDRYDDQLNDIRWEAETALSQNKEQQKDILFLMKRGTQDRFHIMEMGWDLDKK